MPKYVIVPSPDAVVKFTIPAGGAGTAVSFECQVTSGAVIATPTPLTVPATGCEGPSTRQAASSYTLNIAFLQDWGATDSLSQFLWDNQLEDADFELSVGATPIPIATGVCQLVAGDYGGDFANPLTAVADMGITGTPEIGPAVMAATAGAERRRRSGGVTGTTADALAHLDAVQRLITTESQHLTGPAGRAAESRDRRRRRRPRARCRTWAAKG